jgi:hypothetical protein
MRVDSRSSHSVVDHLCAADVCTTELAPSLLVSERRSLWRYVSSQVQVQTRETDARFSQTLEEQLLSLQQSVFQLDTMRSMLSQENSRLKEEVEVMNNEAA